MPERLHLLGVRPAEAFVHRGFQRGQPTGEVLAGESVHLEVRLECAARVAAVWKSIVSQNDTMRGMCAIMSTPAKYGASNGSSSTRA
jgi:hypothetical protein